MNAFAQFFKSNQKTLEDYTHEAIQDLMRRERDATRGLFGVQEEGCGRDFFCLDERTWIWYEEWIEDGERKHMTTRYVVREKEIVKSQNGGPYKTLSAQEVKSLKAAAETYAATVNEKIYAKSQSTQ